MSRGRRDGTARALRLVPRIFVSLYDNHGVYHAAAIAFYIILSTPALLLVLMTSLGYFLGDRRTFYDVTLHYLLSIYPQMDDKIIRELESIIAHRHMTLLTFGVFLWTATLAFTSIEFAVNSIFRTQRRRHFLVTTLISILFITILAALILATTFVMSAARFLMAHPLVVSSTNLTALLIDNPFVGGVIPVVLSIGALTWLYAVLPNRPIRLGHALLGALLATSGWKGAQYGFAWYAREVVDFGSIYGSLTALILLPFWVFYLALTLVAGAEYVSLLSGNGRKGESADRPS
ncbi:MAG: YihY/virulence factor BrkB family protein [Nitrospirota bacterium]